MEMLSFRKRMLEALLEIEKLIKYGKMCGAESVDTEKDRLRMYKFRMDRIRRRRGRRVWQEERSARTEDAGAGEPGRKSGSARTEGTGAEHFARTGMQRGPQPEESDYGRGKMHGELHMRRIFMTVGMVQTFRIFRTALTVFLHLPDTDMIHV